MFCKEIRRHKRGASNCRGRRGHIRTKEEKSQFDHVFEMIELYLPYEETLEGKINLLNYMLAVLRDDVKYWFIDQVLHKSEVIDLNYIFFQIIKKFVPSYEDEYGQLVIMQKIADETLFDISLNDDCVIAVPWEMEHIVSKVTYLLKEPFLYDNNHKGLYFPELKLCFVTSGNHAITMGNVYRKGIIKARRCSIKPAFEHMESDGANWINNTGAILGPVADFRIAAMFEIAKMIHKLKEENKKAT